MSGPEEQKLQEAVWKTRKNRTSRTMRRVEAAGFHPRSFHLKQGTEDTPPFCMQKVAWHIDD